MTTSTFHFSWGLLGNIAEGRPQLGNTMRVEAYRLMLFSMRDVLEQRLGAEETARLFFEAGTIAGWEFAEHLLGHFTDLTTFVTRLRMLCREMGIGIIDLEQADAGGKEFILTVAEDLDCSGVPDIQQPICQYDEGFIAALLEYATQQKYTVREVDCWASGQRICRFIARSIT